MHCVLEEAASRLNRKLIFLWYDFDLDHFYLYLWRLQTEIVCGGFFYTDEINLIIHAKQNFRTL